jgi:hypothetical protein
LRGFLVAGLFTFTLFVSAALLFLIEPLVARMVLPLLGGTPAVWNTCVVFFQLALLAGYGYAHLAPRWLGPRLHVPIHLALLFLPILVLPLALPAGWIPTQEVSPVFWLLALLLVMVGLPFFIVSTSAPLLQKWFTRTDHPNAGDPYFLYAASNLGSILALLAYPLLLEPTLSLNSQAQLWTAGYALFVVLVAGCAWCGWRFPASPAPEHKVTDEKPIKPPESLSLRRVLRWLLLAFVPASLVLSVTTYLTTDIAAIPLLWVVPLAIYLLTFVLAFSLPRSHLLLLRWMPLVVLILVLVLVSEATEPIAVLIPVHLRGLFWIGMVCHGELARDRPDERNLTAFYFWLSAGGVLGGLFNALLAPLLFRTVAEYPLALVLACWLRPADEKSSFRVNFWDIVLPLGVGVLTVGLLLGCRVGGLPAGPLTLAVAFAVPLVLCYTLHDRPLRYALGVGALFLASGFYAGVHGTAQFARRSFFGVHRVALDPTGHYRVLIHGNTIHGQQSRDPGRQREPLNYYHTTGPIGQVFAALRGDPRLQRVGVVGLGTAALCCYAAPGQQWTFYEIDPEVVYIARDSGLFTFFSKCLTRPRVVVGDARLRLQHSDDRFGLLVVDAFSSDAIPVHLLTKEALGIYLDHLDDDGILAFNISNRYLDLEAVLANLARDHHPPLVCLAQEDRSLSEKQKADGKSPSHWVVIAHRPEAVAKLTKTAAWRAAHGRPGQSVWKDDFSNLLGVIRWRMEGDD